MTQPQQLKPTAALVVKLLETVLNPDNKPSVCSPKRHLGFIRQQYIPAPVGYWSIPN
jgi:hypothetical protein